MSPCISNMSESFYVTLPSHSSKNEFPDNVANHFKIRLPNPIRLEGTGWQVGLSSISLPDPKNVLPPWLTEVEPLIYDSWFYAWEKGTGPKRFAAANFRISDVNDILDVNNMTGVNFMKTVIEWLNKQRTEKNMIPGYVTGYTNESGEKKEFFPTYRFKGEDLVVDGTNIEYHDFGRVFRWKSPLLMIRIDLALEMGWFKRKEPAPSDPRFALELGPNLVMELRNYLLPTPGDLRYSYGPDGSPAQGQVTDTYWFIPRDSEGAMSPYVQMSLSVNWRFINLNHSFKNVLGPSSRSLIVYSDVGSSSVVGNQVTDLLREVDYKREGRGSYYFEPTHLQYIKVRKDVIDIIETQVSETDGELVKFGKGNTIVTLHFKKG